MTDVFISYSRADQPIARKLAEELGARGIIVWWDTRLLAGQEFRKTIMAELLRCKACVVIWSGTSSESEFVVDEARRAQRAKKLVPTVVPGFDVDHIPLGFGGTHFAEVTDLAAILAALALYDVKPNEPPKQDVAQDALSARKKELAKRIGIRTDTASDGATMPYRPAPLPPPGSISIAAWSDKLLALAAKADNQAGRAVLEIVQSGVNVGNAKQLIAAISNLPREPDDKLDTLMFYLGVQLKEKQRER